MELHTTYVNGLPMYWYESGLPAHERQQTAAIFLHGIPTNPLLWRYVLPLIDGARPLAWELVGYGTSIPAGQGRDISVARQADYLLAWMDHLKLQRAVLVGHDIGGGVAQVLAVHHPERVQGLVLVDSVSDDSWPIFEVRLMRAAGPVLQHLPDPATRLLLGVLFFRGHDDRSLVDECLNLHWAPYAAAGGAAALIRQLRSLDSRDTQAIAGRLREVNVPARIVWGADDPFQPVQYGHRLARALRAPLHRIDGGRHFVPEDHFGRVAAAVNAVIAQATVQEWDSLGRTAPAA